MKNKYIATLFKCFLYISCIMLVTACANEDLDTNQFGGSEVRLVSFGPSPIARGAELRILGTNLDQVQSVIIPGAPAITAIKRTGATEIRVEVPQTAEVGRIALKTANKEIVSITELTYSEPISISKITPLVAKPGTSVIKIEGEYLNLIKEVIFVDSDIATNHVLQADFISQTREAIEVKVPVTAQTGLVIVSDGADLVEEGEEAGIPIWVYSEEELVVTLPVVSKLAPQLIKPGSELTITGTNFDLVEFLRFGATDIEVTEFEINTAKTEIKVIVPEETELTGTGDIKLVAFSGVEVSNNLALVKPIITSISPEPAKNGGVLIIDGTDLDLVTTIVFGGDVEGTIKNQSATQIEVEIPATATEGNIVLNTYSGQTAEMAYELVEPVISSIAPLSLTAGDDLTITGTDLDLVTEVIFQSGDATVSVNLAEAQDATSFTIRVPFTATNGKISVKTANGTVVESEQSLDIAAATLPVVTEMPLAIGPGEMLTLTGVNLETVTKIGFVYADASEILATRFMPNATGTSLQVYAPDVMGDATIRLYAGDDFAETGIIKIMGADPVVDPALLIFDFDDPLKTGSPWNAGAIIAAADGDGHDGGFFEITAETGVAGGWVWLFASNAADFLAAMPQVTAEDHVLKFDVRTRQDIVIPEGGYANLQMRLGGNDVTIDGNLKDGNVFSTNGKWITVTIDLLSTPTADGGFGLSGLTPNTGDVGFIINQGNPINPFIGLCIDNVRFEKK